MNINNEPNTRNTFQRMKVLEYLQSVKNHPTAEVVHIEVSKEVSTITLATVYRNLNLLAERGEILRLEVNKEYHYDACTDNHQHFLCRNCQKVTDVPNESLTKFALKNIGMKNFKAEKVNILFEGLCNDCKEVK